MSTLTGSRRFFIILLPYMWLASFMAIPLLVIIKVSLAQEQISQPPFSELLALEASGLKWLATFEHYALVLSDGLYLRGLIDSASIAGFTTLFCLLLGYPMAYGLSRASSNVRWLLLTLVVLPLCVSFLLRSYAMIGLLNNSGYLNQLFISLTWLDEPIAMMNSSFSVYVGMVYNFLPFMVIALYADLSRHDPAWLEAAMDLGARPWQAFVQITLPQSQAGILTGCLLVFIPALGDFVVPSLLGDSNELMIGRMIFDELFLNLSWPTGAALTMVFLIVALVPLMLFQQSLNKMQRL